MYSKIEKKVQTFSIFSYTKLSWPLFATSKSLCEGKFKNREKIQNHLPLALYDPRSDPYPKLYWKKKMMYHHCREWKYVVLQKLPLSLVKKRADRPYAHSVIDQVKNGKTISDRHTHIFSSQDYMQTFRWFIIFINSCVLACFFSVSYSFYQFVNT